MRLIHRNLNDEEKWVSEYESLVKYISEGYEEIIYEYTNDLSCRLFIQRAIENGNSEVLVMSKRVKRADIKLKQLLQKTKQCIHGDYPKSYFWFWGVPKYSEELMNEAKLNNWV